MELLEEYKVNSLKELRTVLGKYSNNNFSVLRLGLTHALSSQSGFRWAFYMYL